MRCPALQRTLNIAETYAKDTGGLVRREHIIIGTLTEGESFSAYLLREAGYGLDKLLTGLRRAVCEVPAEYSGEVARALIEAERLAEESAQETTVDMLMSILLKDDLPDISLKLTDYIQKSTAEAARANALKIEIKRKTREII